jgi:hypothetical protein
LATDAIPLISPAPPTGTTKTSTSGASSKISRAIVAAPAMTSRSLYGEMNSAPVSRAYASASRSASS